MRHGSVAGLRSSDVDLIIVGHHHPGNTGRAQGIAVALRDAGGNGAVLLGHQVIFGIDGDGHAGLAGRQSHRLGGLLPGQHLATFRHG